MQTRRLKQQKQHALCALIDAIVEESGGYEPAAMPRIELLYKASYPDRSERDNRSEARLLYSLVYIYKMTPQEEHAEVTRDLNKILDGMKKRSVLKKNLKLIAGGRTDKESPL
jgi:hypothetical protein